MKPEIGDFIDNLVRLSILGRHHRLGGLLADLLQDRIQTLVIELGHIGALRIGALARLQYG